MKKNWEKIDSIFDKLDLNTQLNKSCWFNYEKESQADADLFDASYEMILSDIDRSMVIKLVDYYIKFCNECDSNSVIHKFIKERDSFLTDDFYSIDLHYKIEKRQTIGILSLIYFKGGYILFSMGYKEEKK